MNDLTAIATSLLTKMDKETGQKLYGMSRDAFPYKGLARDRRAIRAELEQRQAAKLATAGLSPNR